MTRRAVALLLALTVLVGACSGGTAILANPAAARPTLPPSTPAASHPADPVPVVLPRDDGPHARLTEWWYYTGHLRAEDGSRYGFEYVIFRAERGRFPVSWVSHLAVTDEGGDRFVFGQRLEVGRQVDRSSPGAGFDLSMSGADPASPAAAETAPWTMTGSDGRDRLTAVDPRGFGVDLAVTATKPPALHDDDGWIDFGPAGGSYYYSRTAMAASGSLTLDGRPVKVEGTAWFDHQWGDFISVGGGGWDWFAVNLADGTDLTLSLVREADGSYPLVYGTVVDAAGNVRHLDRDAFSVQVTDRWTSPATGADYPAGWTIGIPGDDLTIELRPTVAAQELDTRATTGVIYWEGSQVVHASRGGVALGGEGYVELTGYAGSTAPAAP
ncbi:MAG: lipocalin family protein [Chloroflexota bacterium]